MQFPWGVVGGYIQPNANIDYNTGLLSFLPNDTGQYLFAIGIEEYRDTVNGSQLISVTEREIIINVYSLTSIHEEQTQIFSVLVFPNPVKTNTTFQITGSDENKTLIIFDQIGKEIWRKETDENQIEFFVENFAMGLYYYQVLSSRKLAT